jgi:predicted 3-demethylubiquinone-9 3-methyltransferase (glyoxalase superfamily)
MQKITPHLWFDTEAKEAAEFYVSVFGKGSKITHLSVLEDTPSGSVDVLNFELWGYRFDAISAGPLFKFTPAISISVQCHDEAEIDRMYGLLKEGGTEMMALDVYPWSKKYGWVGDKYGLSWQLNLPAEQNLKSRTAPFLMFTGANAGKAEEAMNFYAAVFPDSRVKILARYEKREQDKEGTVQHAEFSLFGETLMAMDSAHPHGFTFNEALSLIVRCDDQAEIDQYWAALSAVPASEQCGWLKDKYGVSWQIVPKAMDEMMHTTDKAKLARVTQAFLKMKKIDIAELERAAEGN